MKWKTKHTKNLIYKSLINTRKTEEQIINAVIDLAVKKELYKFDESQEAKLTSLDSKDQNHIIETVKEVIKDLNESELLKINPDKTVSLNYEGISFVVSRLPKDF